MKKRTFLPAGRLERVFANLIDTIILVPPHMVFVKLVGTEDIGLLFGFGINIAYFTYTGSSVWQASVGQRLMNIYVQHVDGSRLSVRDALERTLAYIMPTLPMYASFIPANVAPVLSGWLLLMWFMPILISDKRMGMHDKLCGTRMAVGKADAV